MVTLVQKFYCTSELKVSIVKGSIDTHFNCYCFRCANSNAAMTQQRIDQLSAFCTSNQVH